MGARHGHRLHFHAHSAIHRLPASTKLVALLVFMLTVVATPREWYAAFAAYLALLLAVVAVSQVPPTYLAKRLVIELPFVVFALLVAIVAAPAAGRRWLVVPLVLGVVLALGEPSGEEAAAVDEGPLGEEALISMFKDTFDAREVEEP